MSLNFCELTLARKRKSGPSRLATAMARETGPIFARSVIMRQSLRPSAMAKKSLHCCSFGVSRSYCFTTLGSVSEPMPESVTLSGIFA